jgi:hypothetical protein
MERYEGEFKTPAIGTTSVPFPIAGQGSLEITDDSLTLRGFRASTGRAALMALVGGAAALGGALAVKFLMFPGMSASTIGVAAVGGLISGAAVPQKAKGDQPLEVVIPWATIKKIGRNPDGKQPKVITILVKKGKPKGMVFFETDADLDLLTAELQTRIV